MSYALRLFGTRAFRAAPIATTARAVSWLGHVAMGREGRYSDAERGFVMLLPPRLKAAGSTGVYIQRRYYEPGFEYLHKLLGPGDVMLDCGANLGLYALASAGIVGPRGRIVAVEPLPHCARTLARSATESGFANLTVCEAAISDTEGTAELDISTGDTSASIVHRRAGEGQRTLTVDTVSLDGLVRRQGLDRVDLVKLDVEGAEDLALTGGQQLLERDRPTIVIEVWNPAAPTIRRSEDILRAAGYGFYRFDRAGRLTALPGLVEQDPTVVCIHGPVPH